MSRRWRCVQAGLPALLMWFAWVAPSLAQTDAAAKPELSAEERAQRQADKVFTFIKLQSVKVAPAPKRAAEPAPVPSPSQTAQAQVKPSPKPQTKVTGVADLAAAAQAMPAVPAVADVNPIVTPEPARPAALLAAASPSVATARAEPEPEPPALQLVSKVEPEIPRQLQADFKGGAVTVRFIVQTDGSVAQAQALQSSHKRLSVAAVAAVNQWRFAPVSAPREATVDIAFAIE